MKNPEVRTLSVDEFHKRYDADPNLCLIDVRELYEWEEVHIPGALHIPKGQLPETIHQTIPDQHRPIYLHCHAGVRSLQAAQKLASMGYREVYSLEGGIAAWEAAGYKIQRG